VASEGGNGRASSDAVREEVPEETRTPVKQGPNWVPLKQAASQAGVSVGTLRNWYRKGRIEARTTRGATGQQRLVRLDEVLAQPGAKPAAASDGDDSQWIGLRQASAEAGVSISTLRNWYRKGLIESRLRPGPNGEQRMVRKEEVMRRASDGNSSPARSPEDVAANNGAGSELVPVARALPDLINQLAQARERAGRAETKSEFLSEQLAEAKARMEVLEDDSPARELKDEGKRLRSLLDERDSEIETLKSEIAGVERERRVAERERELAERERDAAEHARRIAEQAKAKSDKPQESGADSTGAGEDDELPEDFPPEENDEYLALVQRWRARRKRRRILKRSGLS
jgi:hypothetical protein